MTDEQTYQVDRLREKVDAWEVACERARHDRDTLREHIEWLETELRNERGYL